MDTYPYSYLKLDKVYPVQLHVCVHTLRLIFFSTRLCTYFKTHFVLEQLMVTVFDLYIYDLKLSF
jgi:hypothetical protein